MAVNDQFGGGHRKPAGCKEGFGILLMVLSGIVMLGSGLCTIVLSVSDPKSTGVFLVYGGIPFVLATGLYILGNSIRKHARRLPAPPDADDATPMP